MKYSERFFKYPVRCYNSIESEKTERIIDKIIEGDINEALERPEYIKGYDLILPETIVSIGSQLDVFNNKLFTEIHTQTGKIHYCAWSPERFIEKLDQFMDELETKDLIEHTNKVKTILLESLEPVKKIYEQNNINIKLTQDGEFEFTKIEEDSRDSEIEG